MKPPLITPLQDAPPPAAAVLTREIGPSRSARAKRAIVAFRLTESEADKYGLGDRWRFAMKRRLETATRKAAAKAQLAAAIAELLSLAETRHISQREITRKAGLSWGSFRRCRDGKANPTTWHPKLLAALNHLTKN